MTLAWAQQHRNVKYWHPSVTTKIVQQIVAYNFLHRQAERPSVLYNFSQSARRRRKWWGAIPEVIDFFIFLHLCTGIATNLFSQAKHCKNIFVNTRHVTLVRCLWKRTYFSHNMMHISNIAHFTNNFIQKRSLIYPWKKDRIRNSYNIIIFRLAHWRSTGWRLENRYFTERPQLNSS